jgi:pimeloyl-ACP methyl ester carboxylesterase
MRVLFVHGACVVDGAWWWHRMTAPLAAHGLTTSAVELPSCIPADSVRSSSADGPAPLGDLRADIAAVRASADGDEPTVLVGHSYGGMVITGAGAGRPNVVALIYIAGVIPTAEDTLAALANPDSPRWLEPADEHTLRVRADLTEDEFRAHFLADCDEAAVRGALARIGRQSAAAFGQSPGGAAWREVPTTAVVCTQDRATPPARQRDWARRAGRVVELASGHHPFLSRPSELAALIAEAARLG